MSFLKKICFIGVFCPLVLCLNSCDCKRHLVHSEQHNSNKSIVILYDNDVHCKVEGYTKIAGLRNAINASDTANCVIVSCGDYLQGRSWGTLSKGRYCVDLMSAVGYSAATLGNHEFDYGVAHLFELTKEYNLPVTCVNFRAVNTSERFFKPYILTEICGKKIAFVGVVTPTTLTSEYYSFYDQDNNVLYDFQPCVQLTQQAVYAARSAGADYVVLLAHLGERDPDYSSIKLIQETTGIDAVLDGHTHSAIQDSIVLNKDGKQVHFSQTGTQFSNVGKLIISKQGIIHTELLPIDSIPYTDNRVDAVYDSLSLLVSVISNEKVGINMRNLSIYDSIGNRIVYQMEAPIGNFVADAYRYSMNAEIGLCNGGGIRNNLPIGPITYGDLINVNPFANYMEVRKITGKQLRMMLTESYSLLPNENGSFLHVSGLKIHIAISTGIPTITDIQVETTQPGEYQPLDDTKTYIVAGSNYVFESSQIGSSCPRMQVPKVKDTDALKKYIVDFFQGTIESGYSAIEGRIEVN